MLHLLIQLSLFVIFYLFLKVYNLNIVFSMSLARLSPEGPQASSLADSERKNGKNPRDYIIENKIYLFYLKMVTGGN